MTPPQNHPIISLFPQYKCPTPNQIPPNPHSPHHSAHYSLHHHYRNLFPQPFDYQYPFPHFPYRYSDHPQILASRHILLANLLHHQILTCLQLQLLNFSVFLISEFLNIFVCVFKLYVINLFFQIAFLRNSTTIRCDKNDK